MARVPPRPAPSEQPFGLQVCLRQPPAQGNKAGWTSPSVSRWLRALVACDRRCMQTRSCLRATRLPPASRHVLSSTWLEHRHATSCERACASSAPENILFLRAKSQKLLSSRCVTLIVGRVRVLARNCSDRSSSWSSFTFVEVLMFGVRTSNVTQSHTSPKVVSN